MQFYIFVIILLYTKFLLFFIVDAIPHRLPKIFTV